MTIQHIITHLESIAPTALQEKYDNAGLITGNSSHICTGIVCALDCTEAVVNDAISQGCNLIIAHHPILFTGLKRITGSTYVERTIITALKNDIAIYAIHTNLDNILTGVNGKIATLLKMHSLTTLSPKKDILRKLYTFVPIDYAETVKTALFDAGAGDISNYKECSFSVAGEGTFKATGTAHPFVGNIEERHTEKEHKLEVIYPFYREGAILQALKDAHPYEEVAYDIVSLQNKSNTTGAGVIGTLPAPLSEKDFFALLKEKFHLSVIRHTKLIGKPIERVAICGGAGIFLISNALREKADIYITADVKYHEFFDAEDKIILADIGHFESEQFTVDLLVDILVQKFPNFAVLKTTVNTNPVYYS